MMQNMDKWTSDKFPEKILLQGALSRLKKKDVKMLWKDYVKRDGKDISCWQAIVGCDPKALEYASDVIKGNKDIVRRAILKDPLSAKWAMPDLRKDYAFARDCVCEQPSALSGFDRELRKADVLEKMVYHHKVLPDMKGNLPGFKRMRNDPECMNEYARRKRQCLQWVTHEVKQKMDKDAIIVNLIHEARGNILQMEVSFKSLPKSIRLDENFLATFIQQAHKAAYKTVYGARVFQNIESIICCELNKHPAKFAHMMLSLEINTEAQNQLMRICKYGFKSVQNFKKMCYVNNHFNIIFIHCIIKNCLKDNGYTMSTDTWQHLLNVIYSESELDHMILMRWNL